MKSYVIYFIAVICLLSCAVPTAGPSEVLLQESADSPVVEQENAPAEEQEPNEEPAEEEPVIEPIPEPEYLIMYRLSGYQRAETILWSDDYSVFPFVIDGLIKTIQVGVEVDRSDFFLFMQGVSQNFFGFDLSYMTQQELDWMAEVLQRYPEESIWVLQEEWYEKEID